MDGKKSGQTNECTHARMNMSGVASQMRERRIAAIKIEKENCPIIPYSCWTMNVFRSGAPLWLTSFRPSVSPSVRRILHVTQKLFEISSPKFAGIFFDKIYNNFWNNLWPPRSKLASEAKLKISNIHCLEAIRDIQTTFFLWSSLIKGATFDQNKLWPPRSKLTSEAKFKISNIHSSEAIRVI